MVLKFGTKQWLDEYIKLINNNKDYEESAKDWEGDFIFVFEPEDELKNEVRLYIDLWHGKARGGRILSKEEELKAEYIISGKWGNYKKMMEGKLGPLKAIVLRKLKLKGSKSKIMRYSNAAKQLVETMKTVKFEF